MREAKRPHLTASKRLPGGQDRLRQMILYISTRCIEAQRFGSTKLNKILWKADFDAFASRGIPVTGRSYQRLDLGPAPRELLPLRREMVEQGQIKIEKINLGDDIIEDRTVPLVSYDLSLFEKDDIRFVDEAIKYYWDKSGRETSNDSHGVAWETHLNGQTLSYELSYLSDEPLTEAQKSRLTRKAQKAGWFSH